nr:hypothetical protein Iba_scaffold37921CG0360 [Ipomoea batatas]
MCPSLRLGPSELERSCRGYFDGRSFWLDRYVHLRGVGQWHWLERVSRREESGGVPPPWKRRARRIHRSGGRREGGALLNDIDRLRWWWPDHVVGLPGRTQVGLEVEIVFLSLLIIEEIHTGTS